MAAVQTREAGNDLPGHKSSKTHPHESFQAATAAQQQQIRHITCSSGAAGFSGVHTLAPQNRDCSTSVTVAHTGKQVLGSSKSPSHAIGFNDMRIHTSENSSQSSSTEAHLVFPISSTQIIGPNPRLLELWVRKVGNHSLSNLKLSQSMLNAFAQLASTHRHTETWVQWTNQDAPDETLFEDNSQSLKALRKFFKVYLLSDFEMSYMWTTDDEVPAAKVSDTKEVSDANKENMGVGVSSEIDPFTERLGLVYNSDFFDIAASEDVKKLCEEKKYETWHPTGKSAYNGNYPVDEGKRKALKEHIIYHLIKNSNGNEDRKDWLRRYRKALSDKVSQFLRTLRSRIAKQHALKSTLKPSSAINPDDSSTSDESSSNVSITGSSSSSSSGSKSDNSKQNSSMVATNVSISGGGSGKIKKRNHTSAFEDDESIAFGVGDQSTEVDLRALFCAENAFSHSDISSVEFRDSKTSNAIRMILCKCSNPLRLSFSTSPVVGGSLHVNHIVAVVGMMPCYMEIAFMARLSMYEHVRTITFLEPKQNVDDRSFAEVMLEFLGPGKWNHTAQENIRFHYGNDSEIYQLVIFRNFSASSHADQLITDKDLKEAVAFSKQVCRANFQLCGQDVSHNLPKTPMESLFNRMKLEKGDICLDIGCGIPYLGMALSSITGAVVILTELGGIFGAIKDQINLAKQSKTAFEYTWKKRSQGLSKNNSNLGKIISVRRAKKQITDSDEEG